MNIPEYKVQTESSIFHATLAFRWVDKGPFFPRALQQAWRSDTGHLDWRDIPTILLEETEE